jgi:glycosyltransferase involved in cell wall biosynthesis
LKALFIGSYPNAVDIFNSVFFRNLVYQFADMGVECHVISPVSVTRYLRRIKSILKISNERTKNGSKVTVYYPRFLSFSAKKILNWNTMQLTQRNYEAAVCGMAKKINVKFDFAYGHFILGGGLAAVKTGRQLGIPAFIAYGDSDFKTQVSSKFGKIKQERLKGLRGIISVSAKNTKDLAENGFGINIPVLTCPNAVDTCLFDIKDKVKCREKLGIPQDIFVAGFVGSFIERKGDKRLLTACHGLDSIYLAFAGKGDEPPVGENVVFCSSLSHEDVSVFLNAIDIFVLPTLNEGSCNAIIEAMACGKAVVSSDLPFNDDFMTEENSVRIDPRSVEEIRSAVIRLKNDSGFRNKLEDNAYNDAHKLCIENRAETILNFIKDLIPGKGGRA